MGIKVPKFNLPKIWKESTFAFLVLCFFAYSLNSYWIRDKKQSQAAGSGNIPLQKEESIRSPAAIESNVEEKSTYSLVLGCLEANSTKSFQTTAALVQIQWEKCSVKEKLEAKNQTTGESLLLLENGSKILAN
jgi:cbb3-type cytochrome oxidase subunit 3